MSSAGQASTSKKHKEMYSDPERREKHLERSSLYYKTHRDAILEKKKETYHRRMSVLIASQPRFDEGCHTHSEVREYII